MPGKFFSAREKEVIVRAIAEAEKKTSGEIRVHVEAKAGKDPLERAKEIFFQLGMDKTKEKNGVLFYLAAGERRFAVLGDEGIDRKVPHDFWEGIKEAMTVEFREGHFVSGLTRGISMAGEALARYFPYQRGDVNELSDEISEKG